MVTGLDLMLSAMLAAIQIYSAVWLAEVSVKDRVSADKPALITSPVPLFCMDMFDDVELLTMQVSPNVNDSLTWFWFAWHISMKGKSVTKRIEIGVQIWNEWYVQ